MNDFSARDLQADRDSVGLGPAKARISRRPGPQLVSPDELPQTWTCGPCPRQRRGANGYVEPARSTTRGASCCGRFAQHPGLLPGDVIGSGTVGRDASSSTTTALADARR